MTEDGTQSTREVMRDPRVVRLLSVSFLSTCATFLQLAAMRKQVFDITHSTLNLGLLGLVEFVPSAVLVLVTGSVADHFDRRKVTAIGLGVSAVAALLLGAYARSSPSSIAPIFGLVFVYGIAKAFVAPAQRSLAPMVVEREILPRVVALNSTTWQLAIVLGPAASGFLYDADPSYAYVVTAAMLLGALVIVLTVPLPADWSAERSTVFRPDMRSAMEGLQFIRRTPVLLGAIALDLMAVLFGGAVALLPAIAEDRLHVGNVKYGWLAASAGAGAFVVAAVITARPVQRHIGRVLLAVVALFGFATIALGVTHTYWVAIVAVIVLSGADMVSVYVRATLVPLVTPDDRRGRVSAVEQVFIGASNELGAFESGVAAAAFGTGPAIVLGGAATVAVVGIWSVCFPDLRDIDRFEDVKTRGATLPGHGPVPPSGVGWSSPPRR
jgi:MFS family permease